MNFNAIIELVKYTLALAAACFVYTLEKLTPASTEFGRWFALVLLVLFIGSALAGILIFSAATKALHQDPQSAAPQADLIKNTSYIHLGLLAAGVLLLGGKLVDKVLTEVPVQTVVSNTQ